MKKVLTIFCFLFSMVISGQSHEELPPIASQNENSGRRNDIMFSPIALILGIGEVSYEYHLNENSGLGLTGFFVLDDYLVKNDYWYMLPYYRYYFGKAWIKGFFLEGFTGIVNIDPYDYRDYNFNSSSYLIMEKKKSSKFGLGVGFGGKWHTRNHIIFEASLGIGRLFSHDSEPIFLKGMLGVGYRF